MNESGQGELADCLRRVAGADRTAFRRLYDLTYAKLFASIRRILKDQGAAEEVLQESFVKIWRRAGDYDAAIATPIAWMTTIARHAAIDTVRRGAERIAAAGREIDEQLAESLADPSARADSAVPDRRLAACLDGLEADRRSMIVLAYCQGWSREELARRFERPVATVKTLLRRGLIALKECLGDER